MAGRIQGMDGIIDENPLLNNGDLEQAEVGDFDGDNDAALEADGVQGRRGRRRNDRRREERRRN